MVAIELRYNNPHGEQFPWSIELGLSNLYIATMFTRCVGTIRSVL